MFTQMLTAKQTKEKSLEQNVPRKDGWGNWCSLAVDTAHKFTQRAKDPDQGSSTLPPPPTFWAG